MTQLYVAGPLYTQAERVLLESIDTVCQQNGFSTYLPHRDAGLFIRDETSTSLFFQSDRDKLDEAILVIAVLNGLDVDSGTSWEMGYAFGKHKSIIGYLDDIRIYEPPKQLNLMISNSLEEIVTNLDQLANALKALSQRTKEHP